MAIEDIIQIDVWDFAGQFIFLTTHQTYLSDRCVYFLVFDMSKDLDDTVDEEDVSGTSKKTVLGNYKQTIHLFIKIYMSWAKRKGGIGFSNIMLANDVDDVIYDVTIGNIQYATQTFL